MYSSKKHPPEASRPSQDLHVPERELAQKTEMERFHRVNDPLVWAQPEAKRRSKHDLEKLDWSIFAAQRIWQGARAKVRWGADFPKEKSGVTYTGT